MNYESQRKIADAPGMFVRRRGRNTFAAGADTLPRRRPSFSSSANEPQRPAVGGQRPASPTSPPQPLGQGVIIVPPNTIEPRAKTQPRRRRRRAGRIQWCGTAVEEEMVRRRGGKEVRRSTELVPGVRYVGQSFRCARDQGRLTSCTASGVL